MDEVCASNINFKINFDLDEDKTRKICIGESCRTLSSLSNSAWITQIRILNQKLQSFYWNTTMLNWDPQLKHRQSQSLSYQPCISQYAQLLARSKGSSTAQHSHTHSRVFWGVFSRGIYLERCPMSPKHDG